MKILETVNLSKVYGKGNTMVKALDDVTFSVNKGEFVSIVGPSGSGKSTLMHIMGGVDSPTSGKVLIDGTDIATLKESALAVFRRRQIGLVYQFYNLIPILTVKENLTLPLLLDGKKPDPHQLDYIISKLGLTGRLNHLPNQLSGGQQQRVSIGRALINNPAIMLADEPTGNLDEQTAGDIIAILKKLAKERQKCVIVVTHSKEVAEASDVVLELSRRSLVEKSK